MRRVRADRIHSGHVLTRDYSGVIVKHSPVIGRYGAQEVGARYSWALEDRARGYVVLTSGGAYARPSQAIAALYTSAQRQQDQDDAEQARKALRGEN